MDIPQHVLYCSMCGNEICYTSKPLNPESETLVMCQDCVNNELKSRNATKGMPNQ